MSTKIPRPRSFNVSPSLVDLEAALQAQARRSPAGVGTTGLGRDTPHSHDLHNPSFFSLPLRRNHIPAPRIFRHRQAFAIYRSITMLDVQLSSVRDVQAWECSGATHPRAARIIVTSDGLAASRVPSLCTVEPCESRTGQWEDVGSAVQHSLTQGISSPFLGTFRILCQSVQCPSDADFTAGPLTMQAPPPPLPRLETYDAFVDYVRESSATSNPLQLGAAILDSRSRVRHRSALGSTSR